jgi:hypothetical protein
MLRRCGCLVALPLLLLALAGHAWYWYFPRLRPAAPDPGDLPGRLLASGAYEVCVWLPYPHQNLAAFAKNLPDPQAFTAALARLAEVPEPELPGFGPFAVPPADEITACADRTGQSYFVAARIYPALSWVAKAAGRLAGNPWLSGGTVEQEKRTAQVAWQGTLWTVTSGAPPVLPAAPAGPSPAPALAAVALKSEISVFPPGTYRLRESPDGAILALDGTRGAPPDLPAGAPAPRPILLAASAPGDRTPAAFALFTNVVAGSLQLPGAAAFYPPGARQRWSLPAQNLLDLAAGRLPRGNAGGWALVALDAASLTQAEALAPGLAHLVPPSPPGATAAPPVPAGSPPPNLRLGLWIDPPKAREIVGRLAKALSAIPFLAPREAERWRDAETVLTPLARCGRAGLWSAGAPEAFTLWVSGCSN